MPWADTGDRSDSGDTGTAKVIAKLPRRYRSVQGLTAVSAGLFDVVKPGSECLRWEQVDAEKRRIAYRKNFGWTKNWRFSNLRPLLADSIGIDGASNLVPVLFDGNFISLA